MVGDRFVSVMSVQNRNLIMDFAKKLMAMGSVYIYKEMQGCGF